MSTAFCAISYVLIAGLFFCLGALFGFNYFDKINKPVHDARIEYENACEKQIKLQKEQLERYKELIQLQKEIIAEQGKKD